ncbi:uncharacterized protein FIBRA_01221 [Fibroporia radiculosa]|uniref:Major facilitator superfamily (MFS) profile domain-containing protein n=1 Tax=Fibroporia radiculosa TaxID=599839 RepID=J4I8D2_9APHY|nr:uncharacterized protein FIBRA_01221 [Fibroporia radiculosa]CCL99206.1 predicted protein [Fibroporia radiculosa]
MALAGHIMYWNPKDESLKPLVMQIYRTFISIGFSCRGCLLDALSTLDAMSLLNPSSGILPAMTADNSVSDAERRAEILRTLQDERSLDKSSLYHLDSAVDLDTAASASSFDLPSVLKGNERMRRRSELSRVKAPAVETIELAPLPPIEERAHEQASVGHATGISGEPSLGKVAGGDPELAPPLSYVPSTITEDTSSAVGVISHAQRAKYRLNSRIQFAALCYCFFLEGWNDGSTGPLLPRIQRNYGIGFAIVSLLFVTNCIGFLSGAMMNVYLNHKFGFGKVLVIGSIFQLAAYVLLAPGGPFPIMCVAFSFAGFGIALQNAQANGFVGSLKEHARTKFGFLHASYGLGALVAPLVATYFSTARHWSFHYLISACIAVSNTIVLSAVFRFKTQDDVMAEAGQAAEEPVTSDNLYHQIMRLKEVHYLAIFSLIYVGVEVSIGGWIVTFIEQERGGGASAGYISSGFFGGLMLGRIILMWLNRKIGERWVIVLYALIVIGLEVTVWVVPSLFENAIAVSFIGLLMGPMYPILMNHSTYILPKWLLTGCLGYIAGVGQAGSAVLPFITGLLSSKFGIASLQPFIVSMMSTMIVLWALVPKKRRIE